MREEHEFRFSYSVIVLPLLFVLTMWFVFWLEVQLGVRFSNLGIYPRTLKGLIGVITSPFIHADISHLYNNTVPLMVLLAALRYFYREQSMKILISGILVSGFLTWIIGRPSYHIGASGLIYLLVSFIFFKGIITRYYRLVALSLFVVVVYGGLIWYIFPSEQTHISWEGHLSGFIGGVFFSFIYKTAPLRQIKKFDWEKENFQPEQDAFMRHFDEEGNFIELPRQTTTGDEEVYYSYKENSEL